MSKAVYNALTTLQQLGYVQTRHLRVEQYENLSVGQVARRKDFS